MASIEAFHLSIAMDRWKLKNSVKLPLNIMMNIGGQGATARPNYWWEIDKTLGILIVHTSEEPLKVILWSAHTIPSNGRRDFRWLTADLGNWYFKNTYLIYFHVGSCMLLCAHNREGSVISSSCTELYHKII